MQRHPRPGHMFWTPAPYSLSSSSSAPSEEEEEQDDDALGQLRLREEEMEPGPHCGDSAAGDTFSPDADGLGTPWDSTGRAGSCSDCCLHGPTPDKLEENGWTDLQRREGLGSERWVSISRADFPSAESTNQ
ncbi:hypothetical protein WMY93_021991 [Mugilogobius chulae]|uniref:Uncharacterized protein n=1 Tax=Mugilogobius chulae TaxID=88201 RepID=A0AAW0NPP1_9GOBI